jgi:exosortase A-associated hydrolase 2
MEKPFFYRQGTHERFAVMHVPSISVPKNALVMCHPFGEEKLWSHRVFVNYARKAAERGIVVLRFDMMGHGDSGGDSEECTIDSCLSDIDTAVSTLMNEFPDLVETGLLGLRFGATLAALYAEQRDEIDYLVLWEPIIDGQRYMQELLRINLGTQLATTGSIRQNREQLVKQLSTGSHVNVDGYLISEQFYEQCSKLNLDSRTKIVSKADCLAVQFARSIKQDDNRDFINFVGLYQSGIFLKIEEQPFWREIKQFCSTPTPLIDSTLEWWERRDER